MNKQRNRNVSHYGEPARIRRRRAGEPRRSPFILRMTKENGCIARCSHISYPGYNLDKCQQSHRWRRKIKQWEIVHKIVKSASRQQTLKVAASRWIEDSLNSS